MTNINDITPLLPAGEGKRLDYDIIVSIVSTGSRILDLGCGNGELMERLINEKKCNARGVDIHHPSVSASISKGLSVFHGDIHEGLEDLGDNTYDYVILSRTLQQVADPDKVIQQMLRVGKHAIVSFPNFAYWRIRLTVMLRGRLPISAALPYSWYDTPNIRIVTISDFEDFCKIQKMNVLKKFAITIDNGENPRKVAFLPDLLGEYGMFLLSK